MKNTMDGIQAKVPSCSFDSSTERQELSPENQLGVQPGVCELEIFWVGQGTHQTLNIQGDLSKPVDSIVRMIESDCKRTGN